MRRIACALSALFVLWVMPLGSVHADGPARWQVADADTRITILGSVHVLRPGTQWLDDRLEQQISGADRIYMELSPEQQQPQIMQPLAQRFGFLPDGRTLQSILPADTYSEMVAAFDEVGVPEAAIQNFRPWFAGLNYAVLKFAQVGFNPAAGVEATVLGLAGARGIPVDGFETAEFQIGLFADMSVDQEIDFLKSALADRTSLDAVMTRLTNSWSQGDVADLTAYFEESFADFPSLKERILIDRNRNWVGDITGLLDIPGDLLIVVGTGHLVGDDSVIALLQDAGLKVTRLP